MQQNRIRGLASDTLIYGIFSIVGRFLTFMLTPIYSNYLSYQEVADISNIFAIIAFVNIIFSFGMDSAFFRFYSKDDFNLNKKVFSMSYLSIAFVSLLFSLIVVILAKPISPLITKLPNSIDLVRLSVIIPFLDSFLLVPLALMRMTRKAGRFALSRFLMIVIAVSLNVLFVVQFHWGAMGVIIAQLIATFSGILFFAKDVIEYINLKFDFKLFKQMLIFGIPTLPATFSGIILQVADRPIMKMLTTDRNLAIYTINYRLGIPMMMFVLMFEYAWKPFYLSHYEDADAKKLFARILTYFTVVAAFVFLGVGFFIEYIVKVPFIGGKFINPIYWQGMHIIPVILLAYYFNGVFNNLACGFQINKKTGYLPIAVGVAAITNLVMNFILIPIIGYDGAAYATLAAYFISAVILYILTFKVYPNNYEWKRLSIIIITTGIIYLAVSYLSSSFHIFTSLITKLAGLVLFGFILWLFRLFTPEEIKSIKRLFKRNKK